MAPRPEDFLPKELPRELRIALHRLWTCTQEKEGDGTKSKRLPSPLMKRLHCNVYQDARTNKPIRWWTRTGEELAVKNYRLQNPKSWVLVAAGVKQKPIVIGSAHAANIKKNCYLSSLSDGTDYYTWHGKDGFEASPSVVKKLDTGDLGVKKPSRSTSPLEPSDSETRPISRSASFSSMDIPLSTICVSSKAHQTSSLGKQIFCADVLKCSFVARSPFNVTTCVQEEKSKPRYHRPRHRWNQPRSPSSGRSSNLSAFRADVIGGNNPRPQ